jgi:prophage tail gpP-like protein
LIPPVVIFIERKQLIGWTSLRLRRDKAELTGSATIEIFMGWIPTEPVLYDAQTGREVLIYIGGHLAFTGYLDRRTDETDRVTLQGRDPDGQFNSNALSIAEGAVGINAGPNSYRVSFTCRGKTKYLIDSSHQDETGTFLRVTNREVFERLIAPWRVELDWQAETIGLDKVRLRDGAAVSDELQRISEMSSLYTYETRDGRLRVTDSRSVATTGDPLVLGVNITQFQAEQALDASASLITVKGQRIERGQWGIPAVLPTLQSVANKAVAAFIPTTVHLYGDGTDQLLQKRAEYEANMRAGEEKQIQLQVFYLQQPSGSFWDIGVKHYVEIPPAGIYGEFEVISLEYVCSPDNVFTTLTLANQPARIESAFSNSGSDFLSDVPENSERDRPPQGTQDWYWYGPDLEPLASLGEPVNSVGPGRGNRFLSEIDGQNSNPPLVLDPGFTGAQ